MINYDIRESIATGNHKGNQVTLNLEKRIQKIIVQQIRKLLIQQTGKLKGQIHWFITIYEKK